MYHHEGPLNGLVHPRNFQLIYRSILPRQAYQINRPNTLPIFLGEKRQKRKDSSLRFYSGSRSRRPPLRKRFRVT